MVPNFVWISGRIIQINSQTIFLSFSKIVGGFILELLGSMEELGLRFIL